MDSILPGSSTHGIFQARVLEQVAIAFSADFTLSNVKYPLNENVPKAQKTTDG